MIATQFVLSAAVPLVSCLVLRPPPELGSEDLCVELGGGSEDLRVELGGGSEDLRVEQGGGSEDLRVELGGVVKMYV